MKLITKLQILELIGGIFGWIWIIASLVAIYYFIVALFSDGSWMKFFIAMIVGVVCKGLCAGFNDTKNNLWNDDKLKEEENEKNT